MCNVCGSEHSDCEHDKPKIPKRDNLQTWIEWAESTCDCYGDDFSAYETILEQPMRPVRALMSFSTSDLLKDIDTVHTKHIIIDKLRDMLEEVKKL